MRSTGITIRSAKMKLITPPKLIPPFQSTAARGTLPIEQTTLITATSGPTIGPHSFETNGCSTGGADDALERRALALDAHVHRGMAFHPPGHAPIGLSAGRFEHSRTKE